MRLAVVLAVCGCWTGPVTPATETPLLAPRCASCSLFERLGGLDEIREIAAALVTTIAADTRINMYFANADLAALRENLTDHLCEIAGGPCLYSGKGISEAHAGMAITDAGLRAFLEDIERVLVARRIGEATREQLLGMYASLKDVVVGR